MEGRCREGASQQIQTCDVGDYSKLRLVMFSDAGETCDVGLLDKQVGLCYTLFRR